MAPSSVASVVAHVAGHLLALLSGQQGKVSGLVQQVAGPSELSRVHTQNAGLGVDSRQEGGLADFSDLHGQADLHEKGGDGGKDAVGQVHTVAWFDGSGAL